MTISYGVRSTKAAGRGKPVLRLDLAVVVDEVGVSQRLMGEVRQGDLGRYVAARGMPDRQLARGRIGLFVGGVHSAPPMALNMDWKASYRLKPTPAMRAMTTMRMINSVFMDLASCVGFQIPH